MSADTEAEPLPPAGFTEDDFNAAMARTFGPDLQVAISQWLFSEWKPWAREGWARAQAAHDWCAKHQTPLP